MKENKTKFFAIFDFCSLGETFSSKISKIFDIFLKFLFFFSFFKLQNSKYSECEKLKNMTKILNNKENLKIDQYLKNEVYFSEIEKTSDEILMRELRGRIIIFAYNSDKISQNQFKVYISKN